MVKRELEWRKSALQICVFLSSVVTAIAEDPIDHDDDNDDDHQNHDDNSDDYSYGAVL